MITNKEELLTIAQEAWQKQSAEDAYKVLEVLKTDLVTKNFDPNWQLGLKVRMQWAAFPTLPQADRLKLISENLLIPLKDPNFDLEKIFISRRVFVPAFSWPDEVPVYLEAFLRNEEKLGSNPIVTSDKQTLKPTLGNWLREYAAVYSMDKQNKKIVQKHLLESPNVSSLPPQDKKILEKLLYLLESVKVYTLKQIQEEVERQAKELEKNAPAQAAQTNKKQQQISQPQPSSPQSPLKPQAPPQREAAPTTPPTSTQQAPPAPKPSPDSPTKPPVPSNINIKPAPSTNLPKPPASKLTLPQPQKPEETPATATPLLTQKTIKEALQQNPKVANQVLTSRPLDILGRGKDVSPTVQNWLMDYRSRYGATGHTQEDRNEFLLKSPNIQKLSTKEKAYVQALINSYDKGTLLSISEENGQIVFD